MEAFNLLPDPQTNGGLLIAVEASAVEEVKKILSASGLEKFIEPIGRMTAASDKVVFVKQ
jgi:selenide,water dikinase